MNLDKAFVLLFASISGVAGFTPCRSAAFSVASQHASRVAFVPKVRIARSSLFSEVEEATEAVEASSIEEPAEPAVAIEATVEESKPAEPAAFDTAIYIGNISFGEF